MLQVRKLNFYWESGTDGKLVLLKEKEYTSLMRKAYLADKIKDDKEVVLSITS